MALTHLLDTSVYCQPLRKQPVAAVVDRWRSHGDQALCVSVLCEAEVLQGLEAKAADALWERYQALLASRLPILEVTVNVARVYALLAGPLIRAGQPRPVVDLMIAATAKASKLIVATLNVRHYQGLDGVAVEDWSR